MKHSKKMVFISLLSCIAGASDLPKGFEKPGFIEELKTGKVIMETPVSSSTELIQIVRAYFKSVNTEHYIELAINHEKYGLMFKDGSPRIKSASTVNVNPEKTEYEYALLVEADGPLNSVFEVKATGKQTVFRAESELLESKIENILTSHKDKFIRATQDTRIIPFEDGLLVEDRFQIILKQISSTTTILKKQLGVLFSRFPDAFRKELGAEPQ